jgi:alkylhydroperoxidase family enzyme
MVNALRQVSFENEDSNLTQLQLEMIATVVSATNECRY